MVPSTISLNSSICQSQLDRYFFIWHKAIIILIPKPCKDINIRKNGRPIGPLCPAAKALDKLLPRIVTYTISTLLNMAFCQNTQHALHCRPHTSTSEDGRPSSPALKDGRPSSPAIKDGRPSSPALKDGRPSSPALKDGRPSSPALKDGRPSSPALKDGRPSSPALKDGRPSSPALKDGRPSSPALKDGRPSSPALKDGRPSSPALKEANIVRSDARHPTHLYTTLQQYCSKSAATQLCVESTGRFYLGLRQRNLANDLPVKWTLNTQLLLSCLDDITQGFTPGCLKMEDVADLHQEARDLPVRQYYKLISKQFSLALHLPQHPCHQLCHRPPDDRPD